MKKKGLYYTLHILGFLVVFLLFINLLDVTSIGALLVYAFLWSFIPKIGTYISDFFLLPKNMMIEFIINGVLTGLYLYLLEIFAPYIRFSGGVITGYTTSSFQIKDLHLGLFGIIILLAIILSIFSVYFRFLLAKR